MSHCLVLFHKLLFSSSTSTNHQVQGELKTQEDENFQMWHFIVFLGKTLPLSLNIMELETETPPCRVTAQSDLKCKDHTESGQDDKMSPLFFSYYGINTQLSSLISNT